MLVVLLVLVVLLLALADVVGAVLSVVSRGAATFCFLATLLLLRVSFSSFFSFFSLVPDCLFLLPLDRFLVPFSGAGPSASDAELVITSSLMASSLMRFMGVGDGTESSFMVLPVTLATLGGGKLSMLFSDFTDSA